MSEIRRAAHRLPRYCLWIALLYGFGLWWYSVPLTGDEKVYLSTAMEMWERKSWLYPILLDEHSYYKPPFLYWVTLASWKAFGFGNFGAFFPSVIALTGSGWLMVKIQGLLAEGQEADPSETGSSALWFAGCFGTLTYAGSAQMEIWLVLFSLAVGWAILRFLKEEKWSWFYAALALAGVSGLVKSPLYSVFSVLAAWLLLFFEGRSRLFRKPHFVLAHLLGIALGLSWYLAVFLLDRENFWNRYIRIETFGKTTGNGSTVAHMWGDFATFCIPFLLLLLVAWGMGARALWSGISARKSGAPVSSRKFSFLASALLIPVIFFDVFPYRTETYLFLILPYLVLGMDWGFRAALLRNERAALLGARINGFLVLALLFFSGILLVLGGLVPQALGGAMIAAGFAFFFFSWKLNWKRMAATSLVIVTLVRLGAISIGEEDIQTLKTLARSRPNRDIVIHDEWSSIWSEIGVLSAGLGRVCHRSRSLDEALSSLRDGKLLVLADFQLAGVLPRIERSFSSGERLEVVSWMRWKRGFLVPDFKDLRNLGERSSPRWQEQNRKEYKILFLRDPS